jgi:hypothetical protein
VVVVSPDFLPELKKLPDDVLSMKIAVEEVRTIPHFFSFKSDQVVLLTLRPQNLEAKYTGLETDDDLVPHTIKVNLTPALSMSSSHRSLLTSF